MRVESTNTEMHRGDEGPPAGRRVRRRFRYFLKRLQDGTDDRRSATNAEARQSGPRQDAIQDPRARCGGAPARGLERVSQVQAACSHFGAVEGLRASVTAPGHGEVDISVRTGTDGLLVELAALPAMADRLSARTGALGRRLSSRDVKARCVRVTDKSGGYESTGGRSGR